MQLTWHGYRYYPYERALAAREAATLLKTSRLREVDGGLAFDGAVDLERARRLAEARTRLEKGDLNGFAPVVAKSSISEKRA